MNRSFVLIALFSLLHTVIGHEHPLSRINVPNIQINQSINQSNGTITIDSPMLRGVGQMVNITFSNIATQNNNDWIGVWSPRPMNGDYSSHSPSKYMLVTPDSTGSGMITMWMLNMRRSVVVAYFTNGLKKPVLLAESQSFEFDNYARPMHVHLALTGDVSEMRVDWTSAQDGSMKPYVHYGRDPRHLDQSVNVLTTTYKSSDMCGAPATTIGWRDPDYFHTAVMTGLVPNTEYYYQVGDSTAGSESVVFNFWSAPDPKSDSVEFVIFGDLGQAETDGSNEASMMPGSIQTTTALAKDIQVGNVKLNASAAVFHIGDISYARGYATLWEQFFYQISGMQPHLPWMTVDGNHERDWPNSGSLWNITDSGGECGVATEHRFHMPGAREQQSWWSTNFGPVHMTIFNTELDFAPGSDQYKWMENDWKNVDRSVTPFVILAGHRPMYIDCMDNSTGHEPQVSKIMIAALEPLLKQYKVDVGIYGHHHTYQRTCPVYNSTCVSEGTVHIVIGAAGAGFSTTILPVAPQYTVFVEDNIHGYVIGRVKNHNTLTLDFISAVDRSVVDSVTIHSKYQDTVELVSE